jgi:hypothetical protein
MVRRMLLSGRRKDEEPQDLSECQAESEIAKRNSHLRSLMRLGTRPNTPFPIRISITSSAGQPITVITVLPYRSRKLSIRLELY